MRAKLCLLTLALIGLSLTLLPVVQEQLPQIPNSALDLWRGTLELFAVPATLLVLLFTRRRTIELIAIGWGVWMVVVSLWVLVQVPTSLASLSFYGVILVALTLTLAAGLVTLAGMDFLTPPKKPPKPTSVPTNESEEEEEEQPPSEEVSSGDGGEEEAEETTETSSEEKS